MENETDVTRAQMDETRASISEKMETLEHQVVDTVQGAAEAVAQTVDNVKDVNDAVHETVENVKDAFDLRLQVKRHPWGMLGGSIAVGCLGGYLLFRRGTAQSQPIERRQPAVRDIPRITEKQNGVVKDIRISDEAPVTKPVHDVAPAACDAGWLTEMHNRFEPGINKVKGLAIGMVVGVGRDMITQSAPEVMKAGLTDVIDGITVKLGGEPIHGPVLKASACPAAEGRRQRTE
jgi:ElaB/YqjD/DUF883 family membrane-anchored ribosome-binding protein